MNYKTSFKLLRYGEAGGILFALLGCLLESKYSAAADVFFVLGGVGILAAVLQALIFYKCPYCGAKFNIRFKSPEYCPNCGEKPDCYDTKK